jgi:hypothetical protein
MSKVPESRRNVALVVSILLGLVIGLFIKKVSIGLIIGVALGLLVSGMIMGKK